MNLLHTPVHLSPPHDLGLWYFVSAGFLLIFLAALAMVVLVETLILWALRWGTFRKSFTAASLMNLLSSLVGIVVLVILSQLEVKVAFLAYWAASWAGSVLLEGGFLQLTSGRRKAAWVASVIANLGSYALLLPMAWFLSYRA